MGVNSTLVPGHIGPVGDAVIVTEGVSGDISDMLPKLVPPVPVVKPAIPTTDEGYILPFPEDADVACTCSPLMVNWSLPFVPLVVILIVKLVAVIVATDIPVMLEPDI